ncbi:MAG TPA: type VI secretion system tip protein VgrG [Candidatus Acidoferrales bacterium]|nr:type VI secretion system tip protein VgrG [Candidatus Acidoferrales bacterium]
MVNPAKYTQVNRLISLTTPLGEDVLLLAGFTGHEGVSRLFQFNLDLLSEKKDIDFKDIIGQKVTIKMELTDDDSSSRHWNGYVSRFAQSGGSGQFARYHMEVVPWLWFLTRNSNCRIFQNMAVPAIIEKIFSDTGFGSGYKSSLTGTYDPLEYCVQYRETDFNFLSRLMEHNGIYYFFEHKDGDHTLVLADSPSAHTNCPVQSTARYIPAAAKDTADAISAWHLEQEFRTGKYSLNDYNFQTPAAKLQATENTVVDVGGNSKYELYDYPGDHDTGAHGTALAKLRMQEEEASHAIASGSSNCRTLAPGYLFDLEDHHRDDLNKTYLLTDVRHVVSNGATYGSGQSSDSHYSNHVTSIDSATPFRPSRLTPKPFVQGPQTGVVVGGSGEEICVDKFGRVKVQFFWDREGQSNDQSSCWMRVAQPWAGQGWGAIFIPRIGQEVVISFLEGDPDHPIVTGSVYNADQTVPYTLPDNGTRSTIKSRSSKGGGVNDFNELRFEDKKGSEQLFMNAQKDMDINVKNDLREAVANNLSSKVTKDRMESVGGDLHVGVTGNINQKAGQSMSLQVAQNLAETSMSYSHQAKQAIYLKAPQVVIEADAQLTIKVGGNYVAITPANVAITGTMVMINSGGAAGSGSAGSPTDPKAPDQADDGTKGTKLS